MTNTEKKVKTIIWKDAHSVQDSALQWFEKEDALKRAQELFASETTTAGFILENNKHYIVVAGTKSADNFFSDITMIPKALVVKIK